MDEVEGRREQRFEKEREKQKGNKEADISDLAMHLFLDPGCYECVLRDGFL